MARAVALAEGRPCDTGGKFLEVMRNAAAQTGDGRINEFTGPARMLRENFESCLDQETIRERVRCVAALLERPAPLAQNKSAAWRPGRNCGPHRGRFR